MVGVEFVGRLRNLCFHSIPGNPSIPYYLPVLIKKNSQVQITSLRGFLRNKMAFSTSVKLDIRYLVLNIRRVFPDQRKTVSGVFGVCDGHW